MATKYDTWLTDVPYDAEGEWVAERAEELVGEMAADEKAVTEALDNACGFTDYSDRFTSDLARFFIAYDHAETNDAGARAADDLFRALHPHVIGQIASEAHTKAALEWMNRQTGPEDGE